MTAPQLFDLTGRIALITGGSRGLGEEIAEGLGEAGAALMLLARRETWLGPSRRTSAQPRIPLRVGPVRCRRRGFGRRGSRENRRSLRPHRHSGQQRGCHLGSPGGRHAADRWRAVLDVNLTGAFLCAQAAGREMIRQRSGVVLNVSSVAGLRAMPGGIALGRLCRVQGRPDRPDSRTGRQMGAVRHSRELHRPRIFPSRMSEKALERVGTEVAGRIPMGRIGRTGELKGIAVFLASDASSYITGQTIAVDGGATVT